jgi:hypothetical protein
MVSTPLHFRDFLFKVINKITGRQHRNGELDAKVVKHLFDEGTQSEVKGILGLDGGAGECLIPRELTERIDEIQSHVATDEQGRTVAIAGKPVRTHEHHLVYTGVLSLKMARMQHWLYQNFDFNARDERGNQGRLSDKARKALKEVGFGNNISKLEAAMREYEVQARGVSTTEINFLGFRIRPFRLPFFNHVPAMRVKGTVVKETLDEMAESDFKLAAIEGGLHDVGKSKPEILVLLHNRFFTSADRVTMSTHEEEGANIILQKWLDKETDSTRKKWAKLAAFCAEHHGDFSSLNEHMALQKAVAREEISGEELVHGTRIKDADAVASVFERAGPYSYIPIRLLRHLLGETLSPIRRNYQPMSNLNAQTTVLLVRMAAREKKLEDLKKLAVAA